MKKRILALLPLLLMVACNKNDNTSNPESSIPSSQVDTSTSSSDDITTNVDVSTAYYKIRDCLDTEEEASSETLAAVSTNAYTSTTKVVNLDIYSDKSSYGTGTVQEYNVTTGTVNKSDTFQTRSTSQIDKVDDNGTVTNMNMFYRVNAFDSDAFYTSNYSDSFSRVFIAKDEAEATSMGLSEGQYILEDNLGKYVTLQSAQTLYDFTNQNIVSNASLDTSTLKFKKATKDGQSTYSLNTQYSYTSSDYDISSGTTITIGIEFTVEDSSDRLLSFSTEYNLYEAGTSEDAGSAYINIEKNSGTITYEDKIAPASDVMDVNDYFISSVSDVDLYSSTSKSEVAMDKANIPASTKRIYAKPKTFLPSTALDGDLSFLVPKASSDETVVKISEDGSYFFTKDKGKSVTLTYSYSSKNAQGVWEDTDIDVNITISEYDAPTKINYNNVFTTSTDKIESYKDELIVGKTYSLTNKVSVYPSSAKQDMTITSSDSSVVRVDYSNGEYSLVSLKEGEATVRYESVADHTIYKEVTYKAYVPMTTSEATSYFKNKVLKYTETLYGSGSIILTFGSSDTGTFTSDYKEATTKFSWMASSDGNITFYDYQPFTEDDYGNEYESNYLHGKKVIITADKNLWIERPSQGTNHLFVLETN